MYSVCSTVKKSRQIGVRWSPERKSAWESFAQSLGYKPSVLASQVLEEFMACFLPNTDLQTLGLAQLVVSKPGPMLAMAMRSVEARPASGSDIDQIAKQEREIYGPARPEGKAKGRNTHKKK